MNFTRFPSIGTNMNENNKPWPGHEAQCTLDNFLPPKPRKTCKYSIIYYV